MQTITIKDVENIQKHDRIAVTYLNKDGQEVTKNTRFYGVDSNIIIVYMQHKQKTAWEIPEGTECVINKL